LTPARTAYFLNFAAQAFLFIGCTLPRTIFPANTSSPTIPAARPARRLSANAGCSGTVTVVFPRLFSVAICTAILRTTWRQVHRPEPVRIAEPQESVVQDVEHQPRLPSGHFAR
jgi:hypothetical protein